MNAIKTTLSEYDFKKWKFYKLTPINSNLLYTIDFENDYNGWEVYYSDYIQTLFENKSMIFQFLQKYDISYWRKWGNMFEFVGSILNDKDMKITFHNASDVWINASFSKNEMIPNIKICFKNNGKEISNNITLLIEEVEKPNILIKKTPEMLTSQVVIKDLEF